MHGVRAYQPPRGLARTGLVLCDSQAMPQHRTEPPQRWRTAALCFVILWFSIGGVAHFVFTEAQMRIVPDWMAWPRAAVLLSGVAELVGAAGLLFARTRRAAGWGLLALTVAVTPANVQMLMQAEQFPDVPIWALVLRLPLQLVLLALIAWGSGVWRAKT